MNNNIGELKGLLLGIQGMVAANHDSLNRRIDDLQHSNARRFDDLAASINQRLEKQESDMAEVERKADEALGLAKELEGAVEGLRHTSLKSGSAGGAGAGALIAAGIEMIKGLTGL